MSIKLLSLLAATTVLAGACRVNPSFSKLSASEKAAHQPASATIANMAQGQALSRTAGQPSVADSIRVYKIDAEAIRQFAARSPRPYTDVYVYATFCKPCVAELPTLLNFFNKRTNSNLLLVTPENWASLPAIKSFLANQHVAFPTYILDLGRYGDEHAVGRRYQQFIAELYPGHPELLGLPTHLVPDQQGHVLFAGAGNRWVTPTVLDSVMRQQR